MHFIGSTVIKYLVHGVFDIMKSVQLCWYIQQQDITELHKLGHTQLAFLLLVHNCPSLLSQQLGKIATNSGPKSIQSHPLHAL